MWSGIVGHDLAVDLGTANTLIYRRGAGVVINEPSMVARNAKTGEVLAVGAAAKRMVGRAPGHIEVLQPLLDGVIADFELCEQMLRFFIQRVQERSRWAKPRIVICVPSGVTAVERRAVKEAAEFAGARQSFIIEEPMAAAIGAGLPVHEPAGNMIVDIGGGTTEVAVISMGGIVASDSLGVAGDEIDEAIVAFMKAEYSLAIGRRTAEAVKVNLGSATPVVEEVYGDVGGRDLVTDLPRRVTISTSEVRDAIAEPIAAIVDAVTITLDATPPELAADVMHRGIVCTGGGALIAGIDSAIHTQTGMPVRCAPDPLYSVVLGAARCIEHFDTLKTILDDNPESSII
jgi:rod shape-determining protein MreB